MQIQDATVLITGANRGLGKSLVQGFLDAGAKKIYVGSRTPIELSDSRLQPIKLDITNIDDVSSAAERCQDVDILVNNAGVASLDTPSLLEQPLDGARTIMETNYFGTLAMMQAFAPILKQSGGGIIVNVLSAASWFVPPHYTFYSASKFAALALTEGSRIELHAQGTQVVAVHITAMDTEMVAEVNTDKVSPTDVAASIIDGIRSDQEEILADQKSYNLKSVLASNRQAFYQNLLQSEL
ncbi:MAG: SDR family oxidoreductase [Ktedonobacteraceae bacterium]